MSLENATLFDPITLYVTPSDVSVYFSKSILPITFLHRPSDPVRVAAGADAVNI